MSNWIANPIESHRQWRDGLTIAERPYAEQSQRLYRSLFGVYARWLSAHGLNLENVTSVDLATFLDGLTGRNGKAASTRTQRTYAAEIERVGAHLQAIGLRHDNPARDLMATMKVTTRLKPRSIFFPPPGTRSTYLTSLGAMDSKSLDPETVRAHAMNLLMLECGFTLKEVQKITLHQAVLVESGGQQCITAPGHRALHSRTVPISDLARTWLGHWLALRLTLNVITVADYKARAYLSPAKGGAPLKKLSTLQSRVFVTIAGKADHAGGLRAQGLAINRIRDEVIYHGAGLVFTGGHEVGPEQLAELRERGPQTLRNMCCAHLVASNQPTDKISWLLGLNGHDQVWAMQRAMGI